MKKMLKVIVFLFLITSFTGCVSLRNQDVLYQTSTINALLEGIYDGEETFGELKKYGDFGLGTFNALDGEMVAVDGKFYQIKTDGIAYPVSSSMKTPFAVVTFFKPDKIFIIDKVKNYEELKKFIDERLPSKNIFYAIKIEGNFEYIKTRSVPRQKKPYLPLVEVVKKQSIFTFHNVKGTVIGFRCPSFVKGLNVPGYHLHFITEDRKAGGHILECSMKNVKAEIDYTTKFYLVLPESSRFYKVDVSGNKEKQLEKVER